MCWSSNHRCGCSARSSIQLPPQPTRDARPLQADPDQEDQHLEFRVDPAVLFRFSSLTYNAHRIHHDRDYATEEGYPDLAVHGPLQAPLMGELLHRGGGSMLGQEFTYRLIAPTFGSQRLTAEASSDDQGITARVRDGTGRITATSSLRPVSPRTEAPT